MVIATFCRRGPLFTAFSVTGHAGFAEAGEDIVCAAVTSCVQLVCNTVTEVLGEPARVDVEADKVSLALEQPQAGGAAALLAGLHLHLALLAQQYPSHVRVRGDG